MNFSASHWLIASLLLASAINLTLSQQEDGTVSEPLPTGRCAARPAELPDYCAYTSVLSNCKTHSDCTQAMCCPQECGNLVCVKPECPQMKCRACDFGYVTDSYGCQRCECLPDPCQDYQCSDDQVCQPQSVQCFAAPCPPPRAACVPKTTGPTGQCAAMPAEMPEYCMRVDLVSNCRDNSGCKQSMCCRQECGNLMCVQPECPMLKCAACDFGYALDSYGCQTCTCLPSPCQDYQCPNDQVCQPVFVQCFVAPCYPPSPSCISKPNEPKGQCPALPAERPEKCQYSRFASNCQDHSDCKQSMCCEQECGNRICSQPVCPEVKCTACDYGYVTDSSGCQTCECVPSPCQGYQCPDGQICQPEVIACLVAPCPPPSPSCVSPKIVPMGYCTAPPAEKPEYCTYSRLASNCQVHSDCKQAMCCEQECGNLMCSQPVCPAVLCPTICANGYAKDASGCDTCSCSSEPQPDCGMVCQIDCRYGKVLDSKGCPTCSCNPEPPSSDRESGSGAGAAGIPVRPKDDVKPQTGNTRDGQCPADRVGRSWKTDVTCKTDDGCPGNKKCCARGGAKVCRSPDAPKVGTCPYFDKKKWGKIVKSKCDGDVECLDTKKCCQNEIGSFECTDPVATPLETSRCPVPIMNEDPLAGVCADLCTVGTRCSNGQICCRNGCGGTSCTDPIATPLETSRCPVPIMNEDPFAGVCADLCTVGTRCSNGQICCRNGCGGTSCTDPIN